MRIVTWADVMKAKADWQSKVDAPAITAYGVWKRLEYLHVQHCSDTTCPCGKN